MKTKLILGIWMGLLASAFAQQAGSTDANDEPPLPDPILRRAPDQARWTITLKGQASAQPGSPTSRGTGIVKSKDVYHLAEVDPSGGVWDKWNIRGIQVTFAPGSADFAINSSGGGMFYTDFSKSDFPEMAWISKENYTGVQKVGDKDAFVFKMEFVVPGEPPETIVRTAAIDVATQLPIYATEQNRMQVYRFDATPAAPLSVPQKVNDALEAQRKFESPTGK